MLPELGHYALILALCLAVTQVTLPVWGGVRLARSTAYGQCVMIGAAFFILAYAFLSNDFTVAYVATNSNSQLPAIYRFCAVWGAHEGSFLLWVLLLSVWMAGVARFSHHLPAAIVVQVLAILGAISFGFLLFLLTTSNPFARLLFNAPQDGLDLNPLLQDPGLISHPPMLYMGYVGFSVAFAFAIAALMTGQLNATWARWAKPWTLLAWCFLTLGIVLGSWWAYRELGWGGWWFWDPVENASFLPWLSGTALIHSLSVTDKRDAFKAWTALLAIFTFSLSLIGTFLVRSGVLISVHAFAVDPSRGHFILVFLAIVIGGSLALYAFRAHRLHQSISFNFWARENMLLINNLLLTAAMLTILLGTLYPLIMDALGLEKISVGSPYFNTVFIPFMVCILFFMGIAPLSRWRHLEGRLVVKRLALSFASAFLLAFLLPMVLAGTISLGVILGLGLALWVVVVTVQSVSKKASFSQWGMVIAHVGVAVCVIGVVLSTHYSVQREVRMVPGESLAMGDYAFQFLGTREFQGPNYSAIEGGIQVFENQTPIQLLRPEQRVFSVQKMALAKTAIDVSLFRDLYVALGEPLDHNAWSFRIYFKPFVRWIWYGGLLMVIGGLLAFFDKRYRRSS